MTISIDTFGTLLLRTGIVVIMISMGLQITGGQIWNTLRQRRLMSRALLANLLFLPLAALILTRLVAMPDEIATGFLIASVAPGASLSPKLSEIARADVSFAVSLMFVLAVLSVVATPLLAGLLLPSSAAIQFDPLKVVGVLIRFQLIPLLVGLAIHHQWPALADRLRRPSILLANVLFVAVVAFYVLRDFNALRAVPAASLLAMVLMTIISLVSGWHMGGPDETTRQSLALATSVEFTGLALLITSLSFPGTAANISVVAFGLIMTTVNTGMALFWNKGGSFRIRGNALSPMRSEPEQ